ncbi:MAG: hypothetical protein HQK96_01360 [Nitrospirae bacterium]|nr:hypothetical protein [Nitrospirota bacterium]
MEMSDMEKCPSCGATRAKDPGNLTDAEKKPLPVTAGSEAEIVAAQCVCDNEWRGIKPGDDSDDCRCSS